MRPRGERAEASVPKACVAVRQEQRGGLGDGVPENLLEVEGCGLFGELSAGNGMICLAF